MLSEHVHIQHVCCSTSTSIPPSFPFFLAQFLKSLVILPEVVSSGFWGLFVVTVFVFSVSVLIVSLMVSQQSGPIFTDKIVLI